MHVPVYHRRDALSVFFMLQALVHALAALALMGLADLWLLMNLSANFAHARRDIRELPGRERTIPDMDDIHPDAYAIATAYDRKAGAKDKQLMMAPVHQDTDRRHDTHKAAAHSNNRTEHAAMDGLPESVISPPTTEPPKPELESYTFTYPPAELPSSTPIDQDTAAASRGPPSPQTSELTALDPSPSSNTRVFNSTAQRYAAYRLRTATAGPGRSPGGEASGRKTWVR
eukprot:jgi/Chrzof1/15152/Cz09g29080.t1